jgi:hypothetical protein
MTRWRGRGRGRGRRRGRGRPVSDASGLGLAHVWSERQRTWALAGLTGCEAEANVHYDAMLKTIQEFVENLPEHLRKAAPIH